ncbi:MAG: KOW domain-containing RNA-binding protein [Clostridia bacterium]|nr:KOW domain-containing RNA-binding protein [Clostridia bacterium]
MNTHPGEFVYATSGRDAGKCFIVISCEDNYLYLCDGKNRKVSNPKKKKIKHVEATGHYDESVIKKLDAVGKLTNKEVRCSLRGYLSRASE